MNEWMNHPLLKNMNPMKYNLIQMAATKTAGKSGKELMPIMMALITSANKQGIHFTPDEITLILDIIKEGKTPEEKAQIDGTIQMVKTILSKNSHS